ncbi:alkaline ceramidase [Fuerstiella marisgermanici]|uniref:alkaline ceramidase n=1 Tax=Fuerstiella marisgermanici TaxID=1891926 RepID=UPI001E575427|nr:alkaline ceramidase [Fuerstiella marisgermanici]
MKPPARKHAAFTGRIGIARADITPPVGIYSRNWGAAKHDTAASIHRPLTLNALTISERVGDDPLVLIDADLGWWRPLELFRKFQQRLLNELSMDSSRLIFALTHTHAAAPLMEPDDELPGSELHGQWLEDVYQATVSTTKQAMAEAFDATLDWHTGRCGLAANRDLPDPAAPDEMPGKSGNGKATRLICGFNPNAAADDTLLLGRITDASGTLRATLVNYACHPTTLAWENTSISPDYIGAMRSTMEAATGAAAYFLQGMSGDLAPRHQYVGDTDVADRHGTQLAHAALATLFDMEPPNTELTFAETVESGAPLAAWRHRESAAAGSLKAIATTVDVPLKNWPSAAELEQQRSDCKDRALQERLRRKRDIRRSLGDGATFAHPISAWRIGDAVLLGSCSEAYSQLQKDLRRQFPKVPLACMNLINGSIGYLPPEELYDVDVYPVWQTPFDRGGLELIRAAMVNAIAELIGDGGHADTAQSA